MVLRRGAFLVEHVVLHFLSSIFVCLTSCGHTQVHNSKQNQMAQDARRQVVDEFGCCEYSANSLSVPFYWGALSFLLAEQRTKELTPHFVCVDSYSVRART